MQILKWESKTIDMYNTEEKKKLEAEGWEPFAVDSNSREFVYRRPVGYIEVEEKIVKEHEKIKPEQVVTKDVSYNLDTVKKVEPELQTSKEIRSRIDNREFDIEM